MSSIGPASSSLDQVQAYRKQAVSNDVREKDVKKETENAKINAADDVKTRQTTEVNETKDNEQAEVSSLQREDDRRNETVRLGNTLDLLV